MMLFRYSIGFSYDDVDILDSRACISLSDLYLFQYCVYWMHPISADSMKFFGERHSSYIFIINIAMDWFYLRLIQ
jgi:hypothetical protein